MNVTKLRIWLVNSSNYDMPWRVREKLGYSAGKLNIHNYIFTYIHVYTHTFNIIVHPSVHPSFHPYMHLSINPSICQSIHSSIHASVHRFIHSYNVKWLYFTSVLISLCSRFPFYRENKYQANINIGVTSVQISRTCDHNSHCP
jgi:hypothetical protein